MPDDPAWPSPPADGAPPRGKGRTAPKVLTDALPASESYDRIDKAIISLSIVAFVGLLIWFTVREDQFFQYLTFVAILTLIFVGVLRATGIMRTRWLALGGSVTVFIGLIWFTSDAFEKSRDGKIAERDRQIGTLRTEKVGLQSQLSKVQKEFDDFRVQDLALLAHDGTEPTDAVRFTYFLSTGEDQPAKKDGRRYRVPSLHVPDLSFIAIDFSLLNARPDRPGATDVVQSGGIKRVNLRTKPLQLDLYVSRKEDQ